MKFICEKCNKTFGTEEECVLHEAGHQKLEVEKQARDVKEQESIKNINALYKAYYDAAKKHNEEFGRKHAYYNPVEFFFDDPFKTWRIL